MNECNNYDPDNVFRRFQVVEFPKSFIELSTMQNIDIEVDLKKCAYIKTFFGQRLITFDEARKLSASHRCFVLTMVNNTTIQIEFTPKNECISKAKLSKVGENNIFVFDLRLIQVNDIRCCENELHSEIGRYYISGQYEYCKFSNDPSDIDFGNIAVNEKVIKHIRLKNNSNLAANIEYEKYVGLDVIPRKFTVRAKSSIKLTISMKPTCLQIPNKVKLKIRNPHDKSDNDEIDDENYITYTIPIKANAFYTKKPKEVEVESLHKLKDKCVKYTFTKRELIIHQKRQGIALKFLQIGKSAYTKPVVIERYTTGRDICYSDMSVEVIPTTITTYDLIDILLLPFVIDFGDVATKSHVEKQLLLSNKTSYSITITLLKDEFISYTKKMLPTFIVKLEPSSERILKIVCFGPTEGKYNGTFNYSINNFYPSKHPYTLQVSSPRITLIEHSLKFGMVTNEGFTTSVPVKLYNNYNEDVAFHWESVNSDAPFEITPKSGIISSYTCKICDFTNISSLAKARTYDVELVSESITTEILPAEFEMISESMTVQNVPVELNIITKKVSIKFLTPFVVFKDIPINFKTVERVKMENASREVAFFQVLEPLIPGITIEPMCGTLRPKMILTLSIIVQIPCMLEFSFDIYIRINNKENIVLPISGKVLDPKITVNPKNVYMARIPSYMMTYVPVTLQNVSNLKSVVEVLDTGDIDIFDVYVEIGNEKQKINKFMLEGGQSKTVYIKVHDSYRREYEMYIPFKINDLLGPPNDDSHSTELQYYTKAFEEDYENNAKVRLKTLTKEISYCYMAGVITGPWIDFSVENFEFDYDNISNTIIEFTMENISKYYFHITILTSKLMPNFSLELLSEAANVNVNETSIKFDLDRGEIVTFCSKFHPKGHGKFIATAVLFLDKNLTIPYFNLTFHGKRQTPTMIPSTYRVVFPPCAIGTTYKKTMEIDLHCMSNIEAFSYATKENSIISATFLDHNHIEINGDIHTLVTVEVNIYSETKYSGILMLSFNHNTGAYCDVEIIFCFTDCLLTLHANDFLTQENNPYPYYPLSEEAELYKYAEECTEFLEKWMFFQGFRRDLYPVIPDTFHAISSSLVSDGSKNKGIHVSYLNFIKRIAGPLMKHIRKIAVQSYDESFKAVKEIHDTYQEILILLRARGANVLVLQANFLLSYEQYQIYSEFVTPNCNADIIITQQLLSDIHLFERLNKQCWIDFILQTYKVFVMDSCFFDCVCVTSEPRDILKVLITWYNERISLASNKLHISDDKPVKLITNITTDLSDGIAIASVILSYCPFLHNHFSIFCKVQDVTLEADIVNNASLIIEAINLLRLNFPLTCKDFFNPNFLQMLFLSIHLYTALPMLQPKQTIFFNPPLLQSSSRQISLFPSNQETLTYNYVILNNNKNNFVVEKSTENGKKMGFKVKYCANFVNDETAVLLVHGYNKTRIFDTYVVFLLNGQVGTLNPFLKCKVTGLLYRPNRVDIVVSSPFQVSSTFKLYITDTEPTIPRILDDDNKHQFYIRRLNLIEKEINLVGNPRDAGLQELVAHKLYLQIICLSTQMGNSWLWFISEVGEFFVKITSHTRWDIAIDTLQGYVECWPKWPCTCGEDCDCIKTSTLMVPHRNELMLKAVRCSLLEHASETMMGIYDKLIDSPTGKIILGMLLEDGGTNMSEVRHILRSETKFKITGRGLAPQQNQARLAIHSHNILTLPVNILTNDMSDKFTVTFASECGMDIRSYKVLFVAPPDITECN